nr:RNA-directed DNA polymerase, eukaryota, reverse transcriptase zinc-binding domain protein [Tanacetum cinerariifolium]
MGKCEVAVDVSNDTGRNKEHKECEQGNTSGILIEEVLVDDCKAVGNSGLEEEQCKVHSDTQMPPLYVNSKKIEGGCFDDVMVAEGSKKWELTLCGYFVGYKMIINELRYNLRIMCGRYGFKDIVDYNNEVFFMKFRHEEGLNQVVNSGP